MTVRLWFPTIFMVLIVAAVSYLLIQSTDMFTLDINDLQIVNQSHQVEHMALPKLHPWVRVYDLLRPNGNTFECVPLGAMVHNPRICIHPVEIDLYVSGDIKSGGLYEKTECDLMQNILQQEPMLNVADLGGNVGQYLLLAANMGRKVIAIEPMLENVLRIHKSVQLNGFQNNITLIYNALSDVHQFVKFTRINQNVGATRVKEIETGELDEKMYGITQTRSVLLDDLLPLCHSQTLFIKMDIEGSEVKAIRGGKQFFHQNDVRYVLMEISHHYGNPELPQLIDFFVSYGLVPFNVNMAKLNLTTYRTWGQENVLWIKQAIKNTTTV